MTAGATIGDDDLQAALALSMCGDVDSQQNNTCAAATQDDGNQYDEKIGRSSLPLSSTPNCNPILNINENDTEIISKASSLQKKYDDACSIFDCQSFQKLMWDDRSTTTTSTIDDKQRWICERLQLRSHQSWENEYHHQHSDHQDATVFDSAAVSANNNNKRLIADNKNNIANNDGSNKSNLGTPLEVFTGFRLSSTQHRQLLPRHHHLPSQPIWGLTQTHGGPCGVLAAVQAEMIRILLFGRRVDATTAEEDGCGGDGVDSGCYDDIEVRGSGGGRRRLRRQLSNTLYYPFQVSQSTSSTSCTSPPIAEREVTDSLAMAIGMILARAALAPCTATASSCSFDSSSFTRIDSPLHTNIRPTIQIVLPRVECLNYRSPSILGEVGNTSPQRQTLTTTTTKPLTTWLQELLCTPPIAQSTAHCCSTGSHSTNTSSHLLVHTIGAAAAATTTNDNSRDHGVPLATSCGITAASDNDDHDSRLPEVKRLRSSSCNKVNIVDQGGGMRLIDKNYGKLIHSASPFPSCEQVELTALATAVANFLISESGHFLSSVEKEAERTNERADNSTTSTGNGSTTTTTPLNFFQEPGGVMFLVMSLVATRGIDSIRADMDDPNTSLTSNFGHSSQELMNLLLTGRAVSNVFDNTMMLSDDFICHGLQSRPAIGYLTILESLRYCEVGGYYKSPLFPIWIVGSTSHFTVLFGDEQCLVESKSDLMLEKCRRAFQKVEGGNGENGFIPVDKLGDVLDELELTLKAGGDDGVETLKAYLEVTGAGIILWDDFWKACSRLMSGSSLEVIMSGQDDHLMRDVIDDKNIDLGSSDVWADLRRNSIDDYVALVNSIVGLMPDLSELGVLGADKKMPAKRDRESSILHSNQTDEMDKKMSDPAASSSQSDEELARKLAAEWGSLPDQQGGEEVVVDLAVKSDEDYARKLQAMWDAEVMTGPVSSLSAIEVSSHVATTDDVASLASDGSPVGVPLLEGSMMDDSMQNTKKNTFLIDFERHGLSFPLFHYNGLRGGKITCFRVQKLSPTEAIGASIASSSKGGHGSGASGYDLEDVVHTKWPSSLVDWLCETPPSID